MDERHAKKLENKVPTNSDKNIIKLAKQHRQSGQNNKLADKRYINTTIHR